MAQLFTDNAITTLAAGISAVDTELTVAAGQGDNFPVVVGGSADFFVITMENAAGDRELIRVDVRGAASDTLGSGVYPLQRGFDGTTAQAWVLGDIVDLRLTSFFVNNITTPAGDFIPDTDNAYDIGSATFGFKDLYLKGNITTVGLDDNADLTTLTLNADESADFAGNVGLVGYIDGYGGSPNDGEFLKWNTSNGRAQFTAESALVRATPAIPQNEITYGDTVSGRIDSSSNFTYDGTDVALRASASPTFRATDSTNNLVMEMRASNTDGAVGTTSNDPWNLIANNTNCVRLQTSGQVDFQAGIGEEVFSIAPTTSPFVNLNQGSIFQHTVATSANTFSFTNPLGGASFTLILTNGGSQTVNWPGSVQWAGGTEPTLTAAGVDILTFVTPDSGTTWYGFLGGLNFS